MPKLCANLTFMFNEVEFLDRFDAAAKAGFKGVEYLAPYVAPAAQIGDRLSKAKLTQVLFNLPAGDWAAGERGMAVDPRRVGEFQDGVGKAVEYAKALSCKQVNCLAGIAPKDVAPEKMRDTLIANLRFAADRLAGEGIKLLVEPINTRDIPGFYMTHTQQALDVIQAVGSSNLWLQYDIYHMQIMEGDLAMTIEKNLSRIGHMQLADNPGRHEPGTGEINYGFLLPRIDELGYQGWIGCEYKPAAETNAGLGWIKPYLK
ncbi:MAG TPA: hydroxypyruvate isomerase [Polyangia bacterium]|nr:hydroxypyruvate isomerase [Polyangia bacterium]